MSRTIMGCWPSIIVIMIVVLSGCGGAVDTGPAPAGGYNTSHVKYEAPLVHVPKTDFEVGEFVVKEGAEPIRLEKRLTVKNTEVFKFRGQIRGQPKIVRTHVVVVECTRHSDHGPITTASGIGKCELKDDLAVFEINVTSPQGAGRHRVTIRIHRGLRDDGTILPEDEPDSMVIAEGEIEVGTADQKPVAVPDTRPSDR